MVAANHIDMIDAKVQGVLTGLRGLAEDKELTTFRDLIHRPRPGYTTPAEIAFTHALLDSMQSQLEGVERMKSALLQAAQLVE